ncbi:uncharacterized protein LOC127878838 [Dreissena polymorpha]|uniref:uncharacterized protein LOC127878838 n=1 Tax=Dreissena polymorpha TaxID=45954 RepID=UPI0022645475|nr:uncharacterized protein LOC127878838 [Dreissena polymorpha]
MNTSVTSTTIRSNRTPSEQFQTRCRRNSPPILKAEVEEAVRCLKAVNSPGGYNVPSELIKHGVEATTVSLKTLCQQIWNKTKWPKECTQSLVIPLPKRATSRITASSVESVMPRIILNRLKSKAEEVLAEEQARIRVWRGTVEQIVNCRIIIEKLLQHKRDLFHKSIDLASYERI